MQATFSSIDDQMTPTLKPASRMPRRKVRQDEKAGKSVSGPLSALKAMSAAGPAYELVELAALEAENGCLKRLLATKLQNENAWLREQLRRVR
ncbi:hypothetical protein [Rhizobium wenxiniae]|uniref:hypothetical protein n=1 Tax=Rhizobium wenxiniae TaxID=1737357 RepID=UPI003C298693